MLVQHFLRFQGNARARGARREGETTASRRSARRRTSSFTWTPSASHVGIAVQPSMLEKLESGPVLAAWIAACDRSRRLVSSSISVRLRLIMFWIWPDE